MLKLSFGSGGIHRFTPGGVGGCRTMVTISSSLVICSLRLSGCAIAQWVVIPHLEGGFLAVERGPAGKHDRRGSPGSTERDCLLSAGGRRFEYARPLWRACQRPCGLVGGRRRNLGPRHRYDGRRLRHIG